MQPVPCDMDRSRQNLVMELSQSFGKPKSKSESSLPNASHFHEAKDENEKHETRAVIGPPVSARPQTETESILSSKSPLLPNFSRIKVSTETSERHPVAVPTMSADSYSVLEPPAERKVKTQCSCVTAWMPDVTVKIDVLAIV